MEFRIKTVPSETAVSSWSACMIGATAAIALPPQIAVPMVISVRSGFVYTQEPSGEQP